MASAPAGEDDDPLDAYMRTIASAAVEQVAAPALQPIADTGRTAPPAGGRSPLMPWYDMQRVSTTVEAVAAALVAELMLPEAERAAVLALAHADPSALIDTYGHQFSDHLSRSWLHAHSHGVHGPRVAAALHARDRVRRNRRFAALQAMLTGQSHSYPAEFFSDEAMRMRAPDVFAEAMGRSVTSDGHGDEEEMDEDEAEDAACSAHHEAARASMDLRQSARGRLFAFGATVRDLDRIAVQHETERSSHVRDEASSASALSDMMLSAMDGHVGDAVYDGEVAPTATARRARLLRAMAERFLSGEDAQWFNYATVDRDADLDGSRDEDVDAEARYFGGA